MELSGIEAEIDLRLGIYPGEKFVEMLEIFRVPGSRPNLRPEQVVSELKILENTKIKGKAN